MGEIFSKELSDQLHSVLKNMKNPITIKLFVDGACEKCRETKQLLTETAILSEKITLIITELTDADEDLIHYDIKMTPSFIFLDKDNNYRGVKFNGMPAGHEINSFISAIMEMSGLEYAFREDILKRIANIKKPIDLKVFITLSCTQCPGAVQTAHRIAMLNSNVKAQMIDAQIFPEISEKFNVSGVPKIIINDKREFIGNQPIEIFLKEIEAL